MTRQEMLDILKKNPIVAILRGISPDEIMEVCEVLADNGIKFAEITMNSPEALKSIESAAQRFGSELHIGAGTVLNPEQVDKITAAGGKYIISPNCSPAVIRRTKEQGLLSCPGIFTPSEAFSALEAGADLLKLFPAGRLAPEYIKDLKAVAPAEFIATGAVGAANIKDYLRFAAGVGIGSALYKPGMTASQVAEAAKLYAELLR
ncbi:MAG: 2-dehydro-3-deoxy-6-phosphogalactonate aldolase [Victivallales bacterium]